MTSQSDLDQGGTARSWVKVYLGPSLGYVYAPAGNVLPILAGGNYTIDPSTTLIEVNSLSPVTIFLPAASDPVVSPGAVPGLFIHAPIVIIDSGGNAAAVPITIKPTLTPPQGPETIMGLSQIQITVNFGGFTLLPNSTFKTWNAISP